MGFFAKLKWFFVGKREDNEITLNVPNEVNKVEMPVKEKIKRIPYARILRTNETNAYVQSMVKKAYTPDRKVVPYIGADLDLQKIEKLASKIKDDFIKRR